MPSFSAQVKQFKKEATATTGEVFSRAISLIEQGVKTNIRKDTFNMGRSVLVSTTSMPQVDKVLKEDYPEISFSVSPSHVGKPVWIGVQAIYAPRWEFGFTGTDKLGRKYNQAGDFTFQKEGARWPQYVKQAEAELGE